MMHNVSTDRLQRRPGSLLVLALLGSLGVTLAACQTVRPAYETDHRHPVDRPVMRAPAVPLTAASSPAAAPRRLGTCTRRALRLAPPAAQVPTVGAGSIVTVQPVAAAAPVAFPPSQRPDPARRDAIAPGAVQHAKLDRTLRQLVGNGSAASIPIVVRTQPGQHEVIGRWLTSEGRVVHRLHPTRDGLTATLSMADVAALSEDPSIVALAMDPSGSTHVARRVALTTVAH